MKILLIYLILVMMAAAPVKVSAATVLVNDSVLTNDTVKEKVHGPLLRLEQKELDFGLFPEEEIQEGIVKFYNDGDEPLVINQIFTDCGCTAPSYPKEAIQPGESGEIKVRFNGKGRSPGSFTKVLRVRSNALNAKEVLFVKGKIKRPYRK